MFNPMSNSNSSNNGAILSGDGGGNNFASGVAVSFGLGSNATTAASTSIIPANVVTGSVTLQNDRLQVSYDAKNRAKLPTYYGKIKEIEEILLNKLLALKIMPKVSEEINPSGSPVVLLPRFNCCLVEMRFGYPVFFYEVRTYQSVYITNPSLSLYRKHESELADAVQYPVQVRRDTRIPNFPTYIVVALCNNPDIFKYIGLPLSNGNNTAKSTTTKPVLAANNEPATTVATSKALPDIANLRDYLDRDKIFDANWQLNLTMGLDKSGLIKASVYKLDHNIAAGKTNSGKSNFLLSIFFQAFTGEWCKPLASGRQRVNFVFIDKRGVTFNHALFEGLPSLYHRHVLTEDREIIHLFNDLQKEMDDRAKLLAKTLTQSLEAYNQIAPERHKRPIIMVCIEEFSELVEGMKGELNEPLKTVIKVCRKFGIYFYLGGPSFKADIVDSDVVNNSSRWVFGELDSDSARVLTMGGLRPSKILPGRGVYKFDGRDTEFQSFFLEYKEFTDMVNNLRKRYGLTPVEPPTEWDEIFEIGLGTTANSPFGDIADGRNNQSKGLFPTGTGREQMGTGEQDFVPTRSQHTEFVPSRSQAEDDIASHQVASSEWNKAGTKREQVTNSVPSLFPSGNFVPAVPEGVGTKLFVPGSWEQVPASGTSSAPVPPQSSASSRSGEVSDVVEIALNPAQIAQVLEMLRNGNKKSEVIQTISRLSGLSYGRNYNVLKNYYEQLAEGMNAGGNSSSNNSDGGGNQPVLQKEEEKEARVENAQIMSNPAAINTAVVADQRLQKEIELTPVQVTNNSAVVANSNSVAATYQQTVMSSYATQSPTPPPQQLAVTTAQQILPVQQVTRPVRQVEQAASPKQTNSQSQPRLSVEIAGMSVSFETAFIYNVIPEDDDEGIDLTGIGEEVTKLKGWKLYPKRYQDIEEKLVVLEGLQLIEQDADGYYYRVS